MRRSLRWLLVVMLALTAVALWLPGQNEGSEALAAHAGVAQSTEVRGDPTVSQVASRAHAAAFGALRKASLDKARADPFAPVQAIATATTKAPPAAPPPPPVSVAVPINTPPALTYRYLGQIVDPAGNQFVYIAKPGQELRVSVGATLDEGYVVEAIGDDGVRLHHPATDTRAVVAIPRSVAESGR